MRLVVRDSPMSFAENANSVIREAAGVDGDAIFINNDVVFTPNWLLPLLVEVPGVVTPTCNQNYRYTRDGLELVPVMTLDDYVGREEVLNGVARDHAAHHPSLVSAYKTNFFCVRVPPCVYGRIGGFATSYGPAGGEDDDYAVRCHLAGLGVFVAESSYLLHFGGRSTWSGAETLQEWHRREAAFVSVFTRRWGPSLTHFLLRRDPAILDQFPELRRLQAEGGIGGLFRGMMALDRR
jgi:GT2 family glycosyltransferase